MANGVEVPLPVPPQKRGFFDRVGQAARYIAGIDAATWQSPLQPLQISGPPVEGRQWDYPVGYNVNYIPRSRERVKFPELRALAQNCELLRLAIETRKDQICALPWNIKNKVEKEGAKDGDDPRIKRIEAFFQRPDQMHDWDSWTRMLLEELFVTDAMTIYKRPTRGGGIFGYEPLDGTTIFPLIDETGRTPQAPNPAYQQILKGTAKVFYTTDELIYAPRNLRVWSPYGYSPTEQIITTCRTEIERGQLQLAYFTEGSTPDTYVVMPDKMTPEFIKAFEDRLNGYLSGNTAERRKVPFMPFQTEFKQVKAPPLKDEFDEWLARKICYAFSLPPSAFIKQLNRSTSESSQDVAIEEGLKPTMLWFKRIIDNIIQRDMGFDDLEFEWTETREEDPAIAAEVNVKLVNGGQRTINEARATRGEDPIEGGDVAMVLTASGFVEITHRPPDPQALGEDAANGGESGGKTGNKPPKSDKNAPNQGKDAKKGAYSRLGKGEALAALPFPQAAVDQAIAALTAKLAAILAICARSVADQILARADTLTLPAAKAAPTDDEAARAALADETADAIDISDLDRIITAAPGELAAIMAANGRATLAQVGFDIAATDAKAPGGLVDQVYDRAVKYSDERAAEMVGKRKLADGSLIENPNAVWRIDEPTRNEIRNVIADGLQDNIGTNKIADNIRAATAFSEERAQIIAETEILKANNMGALEGMQIAVANGVAIRKEWDCDIEPCLICLGNELAGPIELLEAFPSGDLAPGAHPSCRCTLNPVLDDE